MATSDRRSGRPPEAEREQRRTSALDAALAELTDRGYESMTMSAVAHRAGSSKESLYVWFGSKQGMVAELIERQSAATNAAVHAALDRDDVDPRTALTEIATKLLHLLLGETSVALNRAAMTSAELAAVLLEHGRHTTGPIIESYLARISAVASKPWPDPEEAFRLFYGLIVQDAQIRTLLGEAPPPQAERERRARAAVERLYALAEAR